MLFMINFNLPLGLLLSTEEEPGCDTLDVIQPGSHFSTAFIEFISVIELSLYN